ncbi:YbaK/EbsC family protein [Streptomyces sp. NPDC048282]|uniref:YbaK/EbsC family protein n=1 Tax=Streptomyces sp. NPDC048282 TaxID=3365528 RepID=UPI00371A398B
MTWPMQGCAALGAPPRRTVKALAFITPEDRLLPTALPGHAPLRYGALARAVGVRRGGLLPAGAGRLARVGTRLGGVGPVSADRAAVVVCGGTVGGLGRVRCGSGRPGSSIEIEAADFMAAFPGAPTASIADLPAGASA